jgi:predicted Fe-Mo cluster-binding NifX family protein
VSVKVAIASSNRKYIGLHFGQASDFFIFEIKENGNSEFIGTRKNIPPSDDPNLLENHDKALAKSVDLISDCDVVLASQIGPSASKALLSCRVQSYSIHGLLIGKALKKSASSKLVSKPIPRLIIH